MEIQVKQIELSLGNKKILKEINMDINRKEFVGIIGPNGSGKSTLLKAMYRVLKPDKGIIYFAGEKLEDISIKESALKTAVVAQHNFYNFDFEVLEVVLMGRAPHKKLMERDNEKDYKIARKALKTVGMENFEKRNFTTLSGGEQQRVILARALAQKTKCLILDEPTNHLDIKYQLELMDIVKKLDFTIVAAIHDMNIAAMYCDKIYALKEGKVVGYGTPQELLTEKFIYELFEVKTKIIYDEEIKRMNIMYYT